MKTLFGLESKIQKNTLKAETRHSDPCLKRWNRTNVAVQILIDRDDDVTREPVRLLAEFRGQEGRSGEARRCFGRSCDREEAVREPQSRKLCVVSCSLPRPLALCVPDFSPSVIQSPRHLVLAALPAPTADRTQMVRIRSLHDWAAAADEILKGDSLLSLNTPD